MDELLSLFGEVSIGSSRRGSKAPSSSPYGKSLSSSSSGSTYSYVPSARLDLPTSAVSIVSHAHGRTRREERGIDKRELQEAVKHGRKERANPGRDGKPRWRYTHKGVVYITDDTSRHEITSWRLADALESPPPVLGAGDGAGKAHVVVIVDASGSMRKDDVPGYESRTAAVYDCLARDLVLPQLRVNGGGIEVSILEMGDDATILLERASVDYELLAFLKHRMTSRARSHGNYLPALDEASYLLAGDAGRQTQLFLVFLSDGAPSDHVEMTCSHGYAVWRSLGIRAPNGRWRLENCPVSNECRAQVKLAVQEECVHRVKRLGDLLGRDRVSILTVAFGPPSEDYTVLQRMAEALPRHSFQKLGLSADLLRTAFTSLTDSLTSLRTGVTHRLTLRSDISHKTERQVLEEYVTLTNGVGWDLYCGKNCIAKKRYDAHTRKMVDADFTENETLEAWARVYKHMQRGVAHAMHKFAEGAERVVFQCSEVVSFDGGKTGRCVGPRLVAKSTRYEQHLDDAKFHHTFCRTQGEAESLAQLFNRRLRGGPDMQVHFLSCFVYTIRDYSYSARGVLDILVEEELEGKFTKWNNNNGGVIKGKWDTGNSMLGVIAEDDEEDEDDYDDDEVDSVACKGTAEHVPQCFSHFTYFATDGKKLVCDLQGVWNSSDGFTLTDPVIHHRDGSKRNGATDKGMEGIRAFFATHVCNPLCARLGLSRVLI